MWERKGMKKINKYSGTISLYPHPVFLGTDVRKRVQAVNAWSCNPM